MGFLRLEAASRFELENNGFAGRRLTTWPSRQKLWSGKRDLNSRRQPWQGCTLPLSYSRALSEDENVYSQREHGRQGKI